MAHVWGDRVKESTTTTGTGTLTLAGASAGFQTFSLGVGTGNTTDFCVTDGTNWEVSRGTLTVAGTTTLTRATIYSSSNGGAAVSFGVGTKSVFVCAPASRVVHMDAAGDIPILGSLVPGTDITYDLGTTAAKFKDVFLARIANGATATLTMLDISGAILRLGLGSSFTSQQFYTGGTLRATLDGTNFTITTNFIASGTVAAGGAAYIGWSGRAVMRSPSDGIITLLNNAETSFSRLQLGGTTSAFPAIRRNSAVAAFVLADDSQYAAILTSALGIIDTGGDQTLNIVAGSNLSATRTLTITPGDADRTLTMTGNATLNQDVSTAGSPTFLGVKIGSYTVATLPSVGQGFVALVTNALAPAWNTAVVGGGAVVTMVLDNGTVYVAC